MLIDILDALQDEIIDIGNEYDNETYEKTLAIYDSDLSLLRIYMSLYGEDTPVKVRPNNKFYTICPFHAYNNNMSFLIADNNKAYKCFDCNEKGGIISFIVKYFNVHELVAIRILYSYVTKDFTHLPLEELEIAKKIFKNYNNPLINRLYAESKGKEEYLDKRIDDYIVNCGLKGKVLSREDFNKAVCKISKRLCCPKDIVDTKLYLKTEDDRGMPF